MDWLTWHAKYDRPGSWIERRWLSEPDAGFGVGVHRFTGEPRSLELGVRLFDFVGYDELTRGTREREGT